MSTNVTFRQDKDIIDNVDFLDQINVLVLSPCKLIGIGSVI